MWMSVIEPPRQPGTMIKNTLEIPHGCFYTQLKVFIGVKSTMNCNPSWPAAMLLASLDCAYLYWPPPLLNTYWLAVCCLYPFWSLTFDEPVNDNTFSKGLSVVLLSVATSFLNLLSCCYCIAPPCLFLMISPVYVMLCFTATLSDVVLGSDSDSSQDCQQPKPNDWKLWPQNCYSAKLVQDWLIQIRTS